MDTGAGYNLLDQATKKRLNLDSKKLPNNVYLRTISGGRLPITSKVTLNCYYNGKSHQINFFVTKYNVPNIVIERYGMSQLIPDLNERLLSQKTSLRKDTMNTKQVVNQIEINTKIEPLKQGLLDIKKILSNMTVQRKLNHTQICDKKKYQRLITKTIQ